MATYEVKSVVDGQPTFVKRLDEILADLKVGGALQTLSPLEHISARQRRWYKGICLPAIVKADKDKRPVEWWDFEIKRLCGGDKHLKQMLYYIVTWDRKDSYPLVRLTTTGVGKRNMTAFIEEIIKVAAEQDWPVSPPDSALRKKEK